MVSNPTRLAETHFSCCREYTPPSACAVKSPIGSRLVFETLVSLAGDGTATANQIALFKNNYFPDSWKTAVVIPILKSDKNPKIAQNYRPISLLSSLSKVYEFVLLRRLNQHCAASNMIIPQQCGFRPHCSTVHQLLRVTELIHSGFEKHDATGILFLDIAKAFDKI
ncbi:RNA-directed DNA polymerase from mobile element jockey [Trichonephila clavipes]|nr:RNA-directed DNA polymerase from mobile element jockey [Trichonephila clavipes]